MKTKNYVLASLIFILVVAGAAFAQVPDPGTPGPLPVTREEYNFGDTAFQPTNFPGPVELRASIHYPTNLPFYTAATQPVSKAARNYFSGRVRTTEARRYRVSRATTTFQKCWRVTAMSWFQSALTESTPSTTLCLISAPLRVRS